MFACHLVRCGGAEEKRNESSTAHITGGSLGLSASVSRIPRGEKEEKKKKAPTEKGKPQRTEKEGSPICFYRRLCAICCYPKLQRALIFKELDMGSHIFPLYLFKCLFEERVLKSFLCYAIFSTPGGHPNTAVEHM